ncbi:MAG: hypothetical protein K2J39_03695 [Ruminococcus sp.]|nr:hypothetical protein [Ruminococcus sp.]
MKEMIYKNKSVAELLDSGTYKDYEYAIVSRGFSPCAYVKLPEGHTYYGLDYDDIPVECHGGLTYSDYYIDGMPSGSGWWIGWDYGHCCDYSGFMINENWHDISRYKKWTTTEILEEVKRVIDQLKEFHEFVSEVMRVGKLDEKSARSAVYFAKSVSMHEREKPHNAENAGKSLRKILGKMNGTL